MRVECTSQRSFYLWVTPQTLNDMLLKWHSQSNLSITACFQALTKGWKCGPGQVGYFSKSPKRGWCWIKVWMGTRIDFATLLFTLFFFYLSCLTVSQKMYLDLPAVLVSVLFLWRVISTTEGLIKKKKRTSLGFDYNFRGLSPLSLSCWGSWLDAGRDGAEGVAVSSTSRAAARERASGPCLGCWKLKAHSPWHTSTLFQQVYTSSSSGSTTDD